MCTALNSDTSTCDRKKIKVTQATHAHISIATDVWQVIENKMKPYYVMCGSGEGGVPEWVW